MFWKLDTGFPKAFRYADVVEGWREDALSRCDRTDGQRQPFLREVVHQLVETAAFVAEPVRDRHPHVGERQLAGVLGVQTDLLEIASAGEARGVGLDDQQRQSLVRVVGGAGRDDEQVAVLAVGDERLGSVDDIVVAVAHRGGADAGEVATGAGFGHRDTQHGLAADDAGRPACLLFVVGQFGQVGQHHVVLQRERDAGRGVAGAVDLLDEDGVVPEVVDAGSAVLLVDGEGEQSELVGFGEQRPVEAALDWHPR